MLIVGQSTVEDVLGRREVEIVELVRQAYRAHDEGRTSVPHSTFLRFPDNPRNRIIGLPAYLGGESLPADTSDPATEPVAGIKWVSSFPANIDSGLARASAAIILNSLRTGHPTAMIEGSVISAKRTAASAALAAELLTAGREPDGVALVGCGVINLEVLRFLVAVLPTVGAVTLYDHDRQRAAQFATRAADLLPSGTVTIAAEAKQAMARHGLVSIATTAAEPHMGLEASPPGSVVLHVSLRDIYPQDIVDGLNVVDDADHVCRERTSLHLAEQMTGDRNFVTTSIGALVRGVVDPPPADRTVVFSPFGLGALDLALARDVYATALRRGLGVRVEDFLRA